jgi:hypothetical protein
LKKFDFFDRIIPRHWLIFPAGHIPDYFLFKNLPEINGILIFFTPSRASEFEILHISQPAPLLTIFFSKNFPKINGILNFFTLRLAKAAGEGLGLLCSVHKS